MLVFYWCSAMEDIDVQEEEVYVEDLSKLTRGQIARMVMPDIDKFITNQDSIRWNNNKVVDVAEDEVGNGIAFLEHSMLIMFWCQHNPDKARDSAISCRTAMLALKRRAREINGHNKPPAKP